MQRFRVSADDSGPLVDYLALKLEISKKRAKALLDARLVFLNGKRTWMAQARVLGGDVIEVHRQEVRQNLDRSAVLHEDENLIVFNKPTGILSNGQGSLELMLREFMHCPTLLAVHRLDRDTTGCNLFAKSVRAKTEMEGVFRGLKIEKIYHALVSGRVPSDLMQINKPIDGKPARTSLQVLSSNDKASHLRISLATGRMHQIRKHMLAIGHPIIGDKQYQTGELTEQVLRAVPRQMLHARKVEFVSPFDGSKIAVQAKLPQDFLICLKMLALS